MTGARLLPRNLMSNVIGVFAPALAWALAVPFLINRLGGEAYGVYTIAISLAGLIGFLELGLTSAATKYIAEVEVRGDIERLQRIVSSNVSLYLGIGCGVVVAFYFAAPAMSLLLFGRTALPQRELTLVVRLAGGVFALTLIQSALSAVPRGLQRYDVYNAVQTGHVCGLILVQIATVTLGGGVVTLMFGNLAVTATSLLAYIAVIRRLIPRIRLVHFPDANTLRMLFGFGVFMLLSNAAGLLIENMDKIVVARVLGTAQVMYYAVPTQLAFKTHRMGAAVTSFLFPLASEVQSLGDSESLRRLYIRGMRFVTLVSGLMAVFLATFAREILAIWISEGFAASSAPVLMLSSIASLLSALSIVPYYLLIGTGRPREMAILHLAAALAGVLCVYLGVTHLGRLGAAAGLTVGMGAMALFPWFVERQLAISPRESLWNGYVRTLVCCIAGVGGGIVLRHSLLARLFYFPVFVVIVLAVGNVGPEDWRSVRGVFRRVFV